MKMWGFEAKRARKVTRTLPRRLPWNFIATFVAPRACEERMPSLIGVIGTVSSVFYLAVVSAITGPLQCQDVKHIRITAGFVYRAGAETPLNFPEIFRVSPRTSLNNFSVVDTQTAVLVSTAEVRISAPDAQTPIFPGFLGIHS